MAIVFHEMKQCTRGFKSSYYYHDCSIIYHHAIYRDHYTLRTHHGHINIIFILHYNSH